MVLLDVTICNLPSTERKSILLIFARLIKLVGLDKKIPLSKERVIKLYKPTDYSNTAGYKEWINEET